MKDNIETRRGKNGTTYQVVIFYTDSNGRKKTYKKSFNEKNYVNKAKALSEAKRHRDLIKIQLSNNIAPESSEITLQEVFDLYNKASSVSSETIRKRNIFLYKYIAPYIPLNTKFKDIKPIDITETLSNAKTIATDNTIKHIFSLWRGLYKTAIINDIVKVDQTMKATRPKSLVPPKAKRAQVTSIEKINEVIDGLNSSQIDEETRDMLILAIWIMYYTGMRPAECFALNKSDIDLDNNEIFITKQLSIDANRDSFVSTTKTENSIRVVPICSELRDHLLNLPNGDLFKRKNGKYLDAKTCSDIIRRVCNNDFRLYQLRHQFATDLISTNGIDIKTIQDLMGHKAPSMTLAYMRSNMNKMKDAVNKRNKT